MSNCFSSAPSRINYQPTYRCSGRGSLDHIAAQSLRYDHINTMYYILLALFLSSAASLSTTAQNHIVNIVGLPGGRTQSLPTSYVYSFSRWQVLDDHGAIEEGATGFSGTSLTLRWTEGLKMRPTLDILFKSGVPSYVMVGMQIYLGDTIIASPLARQWTTFEFAGEPNFRIEAFQQEGDDVVALRFCSEPAKQLKKALQMFGFVSSNLNDETISIMSGFHILSIPLQVPWTTISQPLKESYVVSCVATAEPDAETLLTMDQVLLEMTSSSILDLIVVNPDMVHEL